MLLDQSLGLHVEALVASSRIRLEIPQQGAAIAMRCRSPPEKRVPRSPSSVW